MIIAIVEFELAAENQDKVLAVLTADGQAAQNLKGCLGFKTLRVAGSDTGWMLVEEWQDMPAFEAYKASAGFARVGEALMPLMLAPPRSRAFEATLA
ncbi:MAG: antibiotic biosynthesis monooxygenase [Rhodobacteraceae bacterium]|nr:antibiotic biosynthesis monooxygenase [Paracoccaceae bacterium]